MGGELMGRKPTKAEKIARKESVKTTKRGVRAGEKALKGKSRKYGK